MLLLRYLFTSFWFAFGLIWAAVGTVFIGAGAAWWYSDYRVQKFGIQTDATLVEKTHRSGQDEESEYKLKYVFHDTSGQERIETEKVNWETWRMFTDGDKIPIVYIPRESNSSRLAASLDGVWWVAGAGFAAFGGVFALPGWFLAVRETGRVRKRLHLLRTGMPVTGEVTGIDLNYNVRVNGRHPSYLLYSFEGPDGQAYVDRSPDLPRKLEGRFKVGDQITIVCNPSNPREHEADIFGVRGGMAGQFSESSRF